MLQAAGIGLGAPNSCFGRSECSPNRLEEVAGATSPMLTSVIAKATWGMSVKGMVGAMSLSDSNPRPDSNECKLKVSGFGACMISGYPHKGDGFFKLACDQIESSAGVSIIRNEQSCGGFPAPRAAKFLQKRVLDKRPDFVVIQLGSLDALCSVRHSIGGGSLGDASATKKSNKSATVQDAPATFRSRPRWFLATIIGFAFSLAPVTPLSLYLLTMEDVIDRCLAAGATPIVLTPFVYGSYYSMRSGIKYAEALKVLIARKMGVSVIDAISLLRAYPKREVLLHDGFHLSAKAHSLIAAEITREICTHLSASAPPAS